MAGFAVDWFGVVAPGRPVVANFQMIDRSRCQAVIERPAEISELCFFLLPTAQLPGDRCAVLYFSSDGAEWTVLGSVSGAKPSGIFRLPADGSARGARAMVGVVLEAASEAANLDLVASGLADRRGFARAIARDLMAFVTSFAAAPADVVDRWLARFDAKYARDPSFYLKGGA